MAVAPFETEAFTYYALAVTIVMVRIYARRKMLGWNPKQWQGDDFFVLLYVAFFTCSLVCLHIIGQTGTNSNLTNDKTATMSAETIRGIENGSFADFCGWISYTTAIWCLKACLIFMYARMTLGLNNQWKKLAYIATFVLLCYVVLEFTILFHCRSLKRQWQVRPYPGDECTLGLPNVIVLGITNISSDIVLLLIPIPILCKVRLPLKKKLLLALLLCSGIFVILATTLRVVFTLRSIRVKNESAIWAIRETFVATITVNAPMIKPLFSDTKWFKSISSSGARSQYQQKRQTSNNTYHLSVLARKQTAASDDFKPDNLSGRRYSFDDNSPVGSQDSDVGHITGTFSELGETSMRSDVVGKSGKGLRINLTTTCEVESVNGFNVDVEEGRVALQRSNST